MGKIETLHERYKASERTFMQAAKDLLEHARLYAIEWADTEGIRMGRCFEYKTNGRVRRRRIVHIGCHNALYSQNPLSDGWIAYTIQIDEKGRRGKTVLGFERCRFVGQQADCIVVDCTTPTGTGQP